MNIEKQIKEIIKLKPDNKELAIFYDGESEWMMSLGNKSVHVMLGEVEGEINVTGDSIEDVMFNMQIAMQSGQ